MRKNRVRWQHTERQLRLIWRDWPQVALPLRKSLRCSGSSSGIKREVVTAFSWCATGSSSGTSFSQASWTCKIDPQQRPEVLFHGGARSVFVALASHTRSREDEVQPTVAEAMRCVRASQALLPVPLKRRVSLRLSDQASLYTEEYTRKGVILWRSYRSPTTRDREPRSGGDDFVRN